MARLTELNYTMELMSNFKLQLTLESSERHSPQRFFQSVFLEH